MSIVGAGPGDPELISLRGYRLLQAADVILYDALLASEGFQALFGPKAEAVYVGKRSRNHARTQDEINELLVKLALAGKRVVRLKGGDPFVYGRGGEEALYLSRAGIPFELVPGTSSVNGVAALAGIALTHRQLAGQFLVLEGHDLDGADFIDWPLLARFKGTLVWLMASTKAAVISERLMAHGASADLPVALVESVDFSAPLRQTVTLAAAAAGRLTKQSSGPGILYMGPTVALDFR